MKKYIILFPFSLITFLVLSSAVIRNDVILKKYLDFAQQSRFACAGEILYKNNVPDGSCVLIGKRYVLTCAHLQAFGAGENIRCLLGKDTFRIKRFVVYPDYDRKSHKGPDLCVVELDKDVTNIKPALLYEKFSEKGKRGSIVGYGNIEFADMDHSPTGNGQKIGGQNMIDSIGGPVDPQNNMSTLCFADFDSPRGKKCCNIMGDDRALPLEYGLSGGDSGSPLFIKDKGALKVVGIACLSTHITSPLWYGTISGWTRVTVFKTWIKETMQKLRRDE